MTTEPARREDGDAGRSVVDSSPELSSWVASAWEELGALEGVERVGVALVEGGGRRLLFAATGRAGWCHIDAFDDVPLTASIRGASAVVGQLADLDGRFDRFVAAQRGTGFVAIAAVPFVRSGRALGGFVLFWARPQPFDAGQRAELDDVAARLAERLDQAWHRTGPAAPDTTRGSRTATQEFPAEPVAVPHARRFLRTTLAAWSVDGDATDAAALCLSELVTNALVHARSGCRVLIEVSDRLLRVEVHDGGPGIPVTDAQSSDPHQPHGRGLTLVDALATRWGQIDGPERTVVWFAVDLDAARG